MGKEKRKRKPKDKPFPIEFISPFPFEECISRIPSKFVNRISSDEFEFELRSNINDSSNQFINVYGYLQRQDDTHTIVVGEAKFSPLIYIIAIPTIPVIALGFSVFLGNLITGVLFVGLVEAFVIYSLFLNKKRLAHTIFGLFRPIRKTKNSALYRRKTLLFPWLSLNLETDLPPEQVIIRVRQLGFWPILCRTIALDNNEYWFRIDGLFGYWIGLRGTGTLNVTAFNRTEVKCKIGLTYAAYSQIFFMMLLLLLLGVHNSVWLGMMPVAAVMFTSFTLVVGFLALLYFRSRVKQVLML